ncbi:MAG: hypothetical protein UR12_C0004G0013 [candidate division TM6 bacterium GW2011_GWF2_30_66]|jgi:hypothetical protein|nr:MAG: hypothetical protein UR12_C0004G0013 [candidate division TM6 bacterium GW2011_GWF2_30_66]
MKNIKSLIFISLLSITTSNKAYFENSTIEDIKPLSLLIKNKYQLTYKVERIDAKKEYSQNKIIYDHHIATLELSKEEGKIKPFFHAYIWLDYENSNYENNKNDKNIILLSEFNDKSIYKAKMLLYKYWLKKSDYLEKNNINKKLFSPMIKKQIKKYKILSTEPLKIRKKANKQYSNVKINFS